MAKDERVNLLSFTGSCEVGDITVTMAQMIVGLDPTKPEIFVANNKGTDQPAHPCSLISTFFIHNLGSIVVKLAPCKTSDRE